MELWAAIDLRDGAVVQLVGGDPGTERIRLPDPAAVARRWLAAGFRRLHVVDLDAALGSGENADAVEAVAREAAGRATLQVGGGLRDTAAVRRAFERGADRVVLGTRAIEDREWLEAVTVEWPGTVVVAADVRDGVVLSRGWTRATTRPVAAFAAGLDPLPLAGILVTDVAREGRERGADADLFASVVAATRHRVIAAGGVSGRADVAALAGAGAQGVVLGTALYTGRIEPAMILEVELT